MRWPVRRAPALHVAEGFLRVARSRGRAGRGVVVLLDDLHYAHLADKAWRAARSTRRPSRFRTRCSPSPTRTAWPWILRNGRPAAAVVDIDSMDRLQRLQEMEDDLRLLSIALVRAAADDGRRHDLDGVLTEFGIDPGSLDDD